MWYSLQVILQVIKQKDGVIAALLVEIQKLKEQVQVRNNKQNKDVVELKESIGKGYWVYQRAAMWTDCKSPEED